MLCFTCKCFYSLPTRIVAIRSHHRRTSLDTYMERQGGNSFYATLTRKRFSCKKKNFFVLKWFFGTWKCWISLKIGVWLRLVTTLVNGIWLFSLNYYTSFSAKVVLVHIPNNVSNAKMVENLSFYSILLLLILIFVYVFQQYELLRSSSLPHKVLSNFCILKM